MSKMPTRKPYKRLQGYDYTKPNYYFVTIGTYQQQELFGQIIDDEMLVNDAGSMVQSILSGLSQFYPYVLIDKHVIMPNHIHAIIIIDCNQIGLGNGPAQRPAPTDLSLSDIIYGFKSITTKRYIDGVNNKGWQLFNKKIWQRSFYDHIIRNDRSLKKIRQYIVNNPVKCSENIKRHSEQLLLDSTT